MDGQPHNAKGGHGTGINMKAKKTLAFVSGLILLAQILLTGCGTATPLPSTTASDLPLASPSSPTSSYIELSVDEAKRLIQEEPGLVILDVRTKEEYESAHLPKAILIPISELNARVGELSQYKRKNILVYCQTGIRSAKASQILVEQGFTSVYNLTGGIAAWTEAQGKVITPGCG
jgi:rhodanese-related sulfurtransferase